MRKAGPESSYQSRQDGAQAGSRQNRAQPSAEIPYLDKALAPQKEVLTEKFEYACDRLGEIFRGKNPQQLTLTEVKQLLRFVVLVKHNGHMSLAAEELDTVPANVSNGNVLLARFLGLQDKSEVVPYIREHRFRLPDVDEALDPLEDLSIETWEKLFEKIALTPAAGLRTSTGIMPAPSSNFQAAELAPLQQQLVAAEKTYQKFIELTQKPASSRTPEDFVTISGLRESLCLLNLVYQAQKSTVVQTLAALKQKTAEVIFPGAQGSSDVSALCDQLAEGVPLLAHPQALMALKMNASLKLDLTLMRNTYTLPLAERQLLAIALFKATAQRAVQDNLLAVLLPRLGVSLNEFKQRAIVLKPVGVPDSWFPEAAH